MIDKLFFIVGCLFIQLFTLVICARGDVSGPSLYMQPNAKVLFTNETGARIHCAARGDPAPTIEWITEDGHPVDFGTHLITEFPNGSLVFHLFSSDMYKPEVHNREYRCRAKNSAGVILSKSCKVIAVVKRRYEVHVYDETAIVGNIAILRCLVPSSVTDYVLVTSFTQDKSVTIFSGHPGDKFVMVGKRDLYIYNVSVSDTFNGFTCHTVNTLTGDTRSSIYPARLTVNQADAEFAPKLLVDQHTRLSVNAGEKITLPCAAQGYPIPSYTWYREEKDRLRTAVRWTERIEFGLPGLLHINQAKVSDEGTYVCVANNSVGEQTARISLVVYANVHCQISPREEVLQIGASMELECIPGGNPISKMSWYHNARPVSANKRVLISSNGRKLTLTNVAKDDQGMYQCFVINDVDMAQSEAFLKLGDLGPEITSSFSEQTLQPGPSLSLKCIAVGNPPPTIIWKLDGFPLPDSSRFMVGRYSTSEDEIISHLNITSLKEEDGGQYSCTAQNAIGEATRLNNINIYGLPHVRPMPKIFAVSGSKLTIKCPAAGYPIESITWEQGGKVLPINRRQRVFANGTLMIEQVDRTTDAGTYTCQAQNRNKHSSRRDVEVQVLVPPKILPMAQHATNMLRVGMRFALSCQVAEGDLPITFQWLKTTNKKSQDLTSSARRLDEYSSSLVIDRISATHTANYTCLAKNAAGEETFTVPVVVNVPPHFTLEPKDVNILSGQDVTLHCQANGYPVPTIIWKKAIGGDVADYKDFLYEPNVNFFPNGSLHLIRADKSKEGHYMCEANNDNKPAISKVVFVKVNSPVKFSDKFRQSSIMKGKSAHIQCHAFGDNPIEITWKGSKGQTISSDLDSRYNIREQVLELQVGMMSELGISKVFRHDSGTFTCVAKNAFGRDESRMELIVLETPEPPGNFRLLETSSRSISVSWSIPYAGNSPITSYHIQYKLVSESWSIHPNKIAAPSSKTSATVENLTPSTSYNFRIFAENSIGASEPSDMLQVTTLQEAPSAFPQDVKVEDKSSTELSVKWKAPPKEFWNGHLIGYNVGYAERDPNLPDNASITDSFTLKTVDIGTEFGGQTILSDLDMYTSYAVAVQAFNGKGGGPFSPPIVVRTKEGVPSYPPVNVKCMSLTSQSVQVMWEPPPVDHQHGVIRGYRLFYRHEDNNWGNDEVTLRLVDSEVITVVNLLKYTNYSFWSVAFTNAGDGVSSSPVYCRTEEDVPSAPAGIKAFWSANNHIVVSWLPPDYPNGELTSYTLYMRVANNGLTSQEGTRKKYLSAHVRSYETSKLQDGVTYQFWITASTKIGEGESTNVAIVVPSNKVSVAAHITSFSREITTAWKRNVSLPCERVGSPQPKLIWKSKSGSPISNERFQVNKNGSLLLTEVQKADAGNYTCYVENAYGRDEIEYQLIVKVPPDPPELTVINEGADSLRLSWRHSTQPQPHLPILGYVINYKQEHGDWKEIQIDAKVDDYQLDNLWCGTRYQLYMTAYNKIGTGLPCDIVTAYTKGSLPIAPISVQQAMTFNSSAACIWLDMWNDGGCAISLFTVAIREKGTSEWMVNRISVSSADKTYTVNNLKPGVAYELKITAQNNIGSVTHFYDFTSLQADGYGTVPPIELVTTSEDFGKYLIIFSSSPWLVPTTILLIVIGIAAVIIFFFIRRRKRKRNVKKRLNSMTMPPSLLSVREQMYGVSEHISTKTDSTEFIEDVCPYATFELTKTNPYEESTFTGKVLSGGTYRSLQANATSFTSHHSPKNTQARENAFVKGATRTNDNRLTLHMDQESDTHGSTDSEVKRILSRHKPSSIFDREENMRCRPSLGQSLLMGQGDESSASSDMSPPNRKPMHLPHHRKSKKFKGSVCSTKSSSSSGAYDATQAARFLRTTKMQNEQTNTQLKRSSFREDRFKDGDFQIDV